MRIAARRHGSTLCGCPVSLVVVASAGRHRQPRPGTLPCRAVGCPPAQRCRGVGVQGRDPASRHTGQRSKAVKGLIAQRRLAQAAISSAFLYLHGPPLRGIRVPPSAA